MFFKQAIYSKYIVSGSTKDLLLKPEVIKKIKEKLNPPYEDLFDTAEEIILPNLLLPWKKMLEEDQKEIDKVFKTLRPLLV